MAATVSGANTNFDRLRYISERTEIGERREAILSVTIPEQPGAFRAFCNAIGKRNVTEFNYRYETAAEARVFVGLTVTPDGESVDALQHSLRQQGYRVLDMTDNETAKLHLRHMVGGRLSCDIEDEMVFRVEFPGASGKPAPISQYAGQRLQHFAFPLPKPRCRVWAYSGGDASPTGQARGPQESTRSPWVPFLGGDPQSGLSRIFRSN